MDIDAEASDPRGSKPVGDQNANAQQDDAARKPAGRALIRVAPEEIKAARGRFALHPSQGMIAAAVALVLGGGFVAGAQIVGSKAAPIAAAAQFGPPPETTVSLLHRVQDDMHTLKVGLDSLRSTAENPRQDDAIKSLKRSVDVLKQDLEVSKASNAGAVAQLGAKLDRLDRDPTPKLSEISARLDRLDREPSPKLAEIASRLEQLKADPSSPKLAEITSRLDRIERQISSTTTTGSIAAPSRAAVPSTTGASSGASRSAPNAAPNSAQAATDRSSPSPASNSLQASSSEGKPVPKPVKLEGWMLRDVYGGVALLEGRAGGLREVAPGQFVAGLGEIRSIERRGRSWVVVTSRGIIEAENRW